MFGSPPLKFFLDLPMTVTTSTGDSFQVIAPPDVVNMLRETANDLLSRHSSTTFRINSVRKETIISVATSFLKWSAQEKRLYLLSHYKTCFPLA